MCILSILLNRNWGPKFQKLTFFREKMKIVKGCTNLFSHILTPQSLKSIDKLQELATSLLLDHVLKIAPEPRPQNNWLIY